MHFLHLLLIISQKQRRTDTFLVPFNGYICEKCEASHPETLNLFWINHSFHSWFSQLHFLFSTAPGGKSAPSTVHAESNISHFLPTVSLMSYFISKCCSLAVSLLPVFICLSFFLYCFSWQELKRTWNNFWLVLSGPMVALECESCTAGCSSVCNPVSDAPEAQLWSLFLLAVDTSLHSTAPEQQTLDSHSATLPHGRRRKHCLCVFVLKMIAGSEGGKQ